MEYISIKLQMMVILLARDHIVSGKNLDDTFGHSQHLDLRIFSSKDQKII